MSLTLINKSGRQELKLEAFSRERKRRSRPCRRCGRQIFIQGFTEIEHHYCIRHLAVPWTDVVLNVTVHICGSNNEELGA